MRKTANESQPSTFSLLVTGKPEERLSFPGCLALCAALAGVVFLSLAAVHPDTHTNVCDDAGQAGHECPITVFSAGQPVPANDTSAPQPPSARKTSIPPADAEAAIRTDYLASPGRDPPAA